MQYYGSFDGTILLNAEYPAYKFSKKTSDLIGFDLKPIKRDLNFYYYLLDHASDV